MDAAIGAVLLVVTLAELAYRRHTRRPAVIERSVARDLKAGRISGSYYQVCMERLANRRVPGGRR